MEPLPVVVGLDGVAGSGQALAWGLEHARRTGAALHVVHVWRWSPRPTLTLGPTPSREWSDGGETEVRRALDRVVEQALGPDAAPVRTGLRLVESGHAGEALVGTAADAGLLVIGRNRGDGSGVAPGPTARYVTQHATCPVVVVPAWPTAEARAALALRMPDLLQRQNT